MKPTYYLLTSLIEYGESITDSHALYADLAKAEEAYRDEIDLCQENFDEQDGTAIIDLPRCREWRRYDDGCGYTVTLETIEPQ